MNLTQEELDLIEMYRELSDEDRDLILTVSERLTEGEDE